MNSPDQPGVEIHQNDVEEALSNEMKLTLALAENSIGSFARRVDQLRVESSIGIKERLSNLIQHKENHV